LITEKISVDLNKALKAGDKERVSVLRMAKAGLKNEEINKRHPLSFEEEVSVLEKLLKQRRDAFLLYEKGNRPDLASKEEFEISVIEPYLPAKMSDQEIRVMVKEIINTSQQEDFGKIMGRVMAELKGKADGALISKIVKEECK
jgi:uncharacterized protein